MAAGTAAQAAGAAKAKKAMNGAREAERIRQKGYQDEASAVFDKSKANADKGSQDSQQAASEAARQEAYAKNVEDAKAPALAIGDNLAGDNSASAVINDEAARQSSRATAFAAQQGNAKAALQSFGDLQFNNSIYNNRAGNQLGTLGNFMRGSANVLPYEMEAASHKGDGLNALGSILQLGGTVAGVGAGAGWWGGGEAAAGAAPGYNATGAGFKSFGGAGPYTPGWSTLPPSSLPPPPAKLWDFSSLLKK